MRIVIRNGHVIDPANNTSEIRDIYITKGHIVSTGNAPDGFKANREIDATGKTVCPGLIDLCARFREPGLEHKATIASESAAAASAGITTVVCPPDTDPIIDTPAVAKLIQERAGQAGQTRILPLGALTRNLEGEQLSEMAALRDAGCIGMGNIHAIKDTKIMRHAMEYASSHGLTVFIRPMDYWLYDNGCVHEGTVSTRLGLPGIPEAAETTAVARDLALVEQIGVRIHFSQLSSARAVQMIARAKHDGLPVSADVSAHQLFLTEMDLLDFDPVHHVQPPLRNQSDRDGLRKGVAKGTIRAICSDHQPHEPDAKLAPFCATEPGISALETLLPLTLRLVEEKVFTLSEAIACLTIEPARILGVDSGTLSPGATADVCILDSEKIWQLQKHNMLSRGTNTPFNHWEFKGKVTHTLLAGRVVFELEP
ncbi:MAG: dihydroorotase [Gammaproteobacteria bacterium]|nr:dihydroorotase [Gammaproteobacteria bacterium]